MGYEGSNLFYYNRLWWYEIGKVRLFNKNTALCELVKGGIGCDMCQVRRDEIAWSVMAILISSRKRRL